MRSRFFLILPLQDLEQYAALYPPGFGVKTTRHAKHVVGGGWRRLFNRTPYRFRQRHPWQQIPAMDGSLVDTKNPNPEFLVQ